MENLDNLKESLAFLIETLPEAMDQEIIESHKTQIDQFLKEYPLDRPLDPESFNCFFQDEQDSVKHHLIKLYFPDAKDNPSLVEAIFAWNDIYYIVGKLVEQKHKTSMCCMDCARWIANAYLTYLRSHTLPDMTIGKEVFYKPRFGEAQTWMDLCAGITGLHYGKAQAFVDAYQKLYSQPI